MRDVTSAGELKVNATLLPLSQLTALLGAALCARSTERAKSEESGRAAAKCSERAQRNAKQKKNHARVTIRQAHTCSDLHTRVSVCVWMLLAASSAALLRLNEKNKSTNNNKSNNTDSF